MRNDTVIDLTTPEWIDPLTDLLRSGARKLITEACSPSAQCGPLARILHKKDGKAPVIRYNSVT